jgi:hypothetical protein
MNLHNERGGALILALLVAAVCALIGMSFLASALNTNRIASNEQASARALSIAEAGIDRARLQLATGDMNTVLGAGGALFTNQSLDSGSYTVVVSNNLAPRFPLGLIPADSGGATVDTDGYVVINSTGTLGNAQRQIEIIFRQSAHAYAYAVWTATSATFSGPSYTDSYNSASGPYVNPGGTSGNAFSNGSMTMTGGSMINGSATVGGTIDPSHVAGGAANVTTGASPQTMPNPSCPGSYTAAANVSSGPGVSYDPTTGILNVSGGGSVTITAPPYSVSLSKLTLSGGSTLTIDGGGNHVDVYVATKVDISGGTLVNPTSLPAMMTLSACGPAADSWVVSGGSDAAFVVYAPTRDITLSGSSPIFGAVYGNTVTSSGGSAIHYDTALNSSPGDVVSRSWGEIYK